MKCSYYREKGYCSKDNHPMDTSDMGDCIYGNGEIREASVHCTEGKKFLGIKEETVSKRIDVTRLNRIAEEHGLYGNKVTDYLPRR